MLLFLQKNLGVDSDEAKKWESEFSAYMTENLSLLESFADRSRKAFKKPDQPCKEEDSGATFHHVALKINSTVERESQMVRSNLFIKRVSQVSFSLRFVKGKNPKTALWNSAFSLLL